MKNPNRFPAKIHLAAAVFFNAAIAWIVVTYARHFIHEPDLWWHLAHGRFMVENLVFLRSDVFSHTRPDVPWINFEWLSQVLIYLIYKAGGLTGVFLTKTILSVTAVGWVALAAFRRGARGPLLAFLIWLSFHLLQARLCARVELTTLNLMGILVFLILEAHGSLNAARLRFVPWIISVLMIFWCNLHAGFIYGFGLLAAFHIGSRLGPRDEKFILFLNRSTWLALPGLVLNPFGPRLITVFFKVMADFRHYPSSFIEEWTRPTLAAAPYFWGTLGLALLLIIGLSLRRDRGVLLWIPALLIFGLYGTRYFRTTALFAFVAVPFFAFAAHRFGPHPVAEGLLGKKSAVWWLICLMPLFVDGQFFTKHLPPGIVDTRAYPIGACRFVQEKNIDGKMINPLGYGGYIDWALGPVRKVFVDGRYIFYPVLVDEQKIGDRRDTAFSESAWQGFFDRYGVDYAITRFQEPLFHSAEEFFKFRSSLSFMFPKSDWALVYWDEASLVFVKRVEKFQAVIKNEEYKDLEPYNAGHMIVLARKNQAFRERLASELERSVREVGGTRRGSQIAALLAAK